jgi:hypothetical protein
MRILRHALAYARASPRKFYAADDVSQMSLNLMHDFPAGLACWYPAPDRIPHFKASGTAETIAARFDV